MGWMPTDNATRYAMGLPVLGREENQANRESVADRQKRALQSAEDIEEKRQQGETQRTQMKIDAEERRRGGPGGEQKIFTQPGGEQQIYGSSSYKHGGPVIKASSKFNYPNYNGDSSVLAKRRNGQ